ncbi:MAG: UTP--glucose-1-phosphate uridylyltransferase GalU [Nanoarchaeota archaeon]|nr:UTP--glucose-1-phosphate uridylyltransferase GalU [Nanoarchaeota archaeon]
MVRQTHHAVIRKVVIPVAGLGTRFLPATKAQPKEMLAIVDKPIIQYLVEEAVASGITDIIFVTGRGKRAIEDHFDYAPDLERALQEKGKEDLLEKVREVSRLANITYVRQKEPKGDGDAILCAAHLLDGEPFAVLFGDDIVDADVPALKQLIKTYEKYKASVIALEEVDMKDVSKFGVVGGEEAGAGVYKIHTFVEKPRPENAPSNLAVVGKYIVAPEVLTRLRNIRKPEGEELRLADAFTEACKEGVPVYGLKFQGTWYDCGSKIGFLKATVEFALKHPEVRDEFLEYLRGRVRG